MVRYLPFLISLVLTVYALFSCIRTRNEDVPHLPKLVWLVLIVFVPFAGPIAWLLMARYAGRPQRPLRQASSPAGPVAPDDDPDFLASLERFRDPRIGGPAAPRDAAPGKPEDKTPESSAGDAEAVPDEPKDSGKQAPTESDEGKA